MKKQLSGLKKYINKSKVDNFWKRRTEIKDPLVSIHFKIDNTHTFDEKLVNEYVKKNYSVLDLACGTCFLANRLTSKVKFIKAVDKYGKFLKYCNRSENLITVEKDIINFKDKIKYNVILLFGIMNYFDDIDAVKIYENCKKMLKKNGVLIVKHQCGINEDVVVDNYSKIIDDNYHAVYRELKNDKRLLHLFFKKIKIIDIYPKKLNPWKNTHFYAFVCQK